MANLEIINYIKNAFAQGQDLAQIRVALTQNGWVDQDITEAIIQSGVTQNQTEVPQAPQQESPLPDQVPTAIFSQPKPSSEKQSYYIVALSIALAILLIGGGVFAYFKLPTHSNFTLPTPDNNIILPGDNTSLNKTILQKLNVARQRGNHAAVLVDFTTIVTEAALYYADNNSYGHTGSKTNGGVCKEATIARIMQDMKTVFGNAPGNAPVCTTNATRYSPATNFTVYLKFPNGHYFCIDSNNGTGKDIGTSLASYRAGVSCGG